MFGKTHERIIRRWKQLPTIFWGIVLLYACVLVNDIWFLAWRWDKPASNPGGPLASMGGWVMAWEVSTTTLPLAVTFLLPITRFWRKRDTESK